MVSEAYASVLIGLRRHLWGEERLDDIEAKRMSSKLTPGRAPQARGKLPRSLRFERELMKGRVALEVPKTEQEDSKPF